MKNTGVSETILKTASGLLLKWETKGIALDACLNELRTAGEGSVYFSSVSSILFEYFRHKDFVDRMVFTYAKRKKMQSVLQSILCCVITQVYFQNGISAQSAVNIAVELVKKTVNSGAGGFVNAVMHAIIRDREMRSDDLSVSFPQYLKDRWIQNFGEKQALFMIEQFASNPLISFRVRGEISAADLSEICALKINIPDFDADIFYYESNNPSALFYSDAWNAGKIYIQDPAASMLFSLPEPNTICGRILDACAAPGGKTIFLYDMLSKNNVFFSLLVADRSVARIRQMKENFQRMKINANLIHSDACSLPDDMRNLDWVIADVPCSNTGVIRRRPDVPWRFTPQRLNEFVHLQKSILDALSNRISKKGYLLYSTCSVEPEENFMQIEAFLKKNSEYMLVRQKQIYPTEKHDGAFAALLKRME